MLKRVVIVGAGVVGCSCAVELLERGFDVVVLERARNVGAEGSGRSMGSLRLQGRLVPEVPLARVALERWIALGERTDIELVRGGNLYVAQLADELPLLERLELEAHATGLESVRMVGSAEACDIAPFRPEAVVGGLYGPDDAHCNPRMAVGALAALAQEGGADLRFGVTVEGLARAADSTLTGVHVAGGELLRADSVVVAAGVGSPRLLRSVGLDLPIKEMLVSQAETAATGPLFQATLRGRRFSARQRPTGELVLGAGLDARVDRLVSLDDLRRLRQWLPRYRVHRRSIRLRFGTRATRFRHLVTGQPGRDRELVYLAPNQSLIDRSYTWLREAVVPTLPPVARYWTGYVDHTLDGLPVIDHPPRVDNLVVAAGFSGHGLAIAPGVGLAVADLVATGESRLDLSAFRLARFDEAELGMPHQFI